MPTLSRLDPKLPGIVQHLPIYEMGSSLTLRTVSPSDVLLSEPTKSPLFNFNSFVAEEIIGKTENKNAIEYNRKFIEPLYELNTPEEPNPSMNVLGY